MQLMSLAVSVDIQWTGNRLSGCVTAGDIANACESVEFRQHVWSADPIYDHLIEVCDTWNTKYLAPSA